MSNTDEGRWLEGLDERTERERMVDNPLKMNAVCYWCEHPACGGTCLGVDNATGPVQMRPNDPAYWMLSDGRVSTPEVHRESCYVCRDPEFARMGLPLCKACPRCGGHVQADGDGTCDDCGFDMASHHPCSRCGEAVPASGPCPDCPPTTIDTEETPS